MAAQTRNSGNAGNSWKTGNPGSGALQQGADRLDGVVREVRRRQRELTGDALKAPVLDPSEVWARKFLSEGFGPGTCPECSLAPLDVAAPPQQRAQLMRELKARADASCRPGRVDAYQAAPTQMPRSNPPGSGTSHGLPGPSMQRPFAPAEKKRRSWLEWFLGW